MTDLTRIASDIRNKFHKTRLTKEFHYAFDPDDVDAVVTAIRWYAMELDMQKHGRHRDETKRTVTITLVV